MQHRPWPSLKRPNDTSGLRVFPFHWNSRKSEFQEFRSGPTQSSFVVKENCAKDGSLLLSQHHSKHLFFSHGRKAAEETVNVFDCYYTQVSLRWAWPFLLLLCWLAVLNSFSPQGSCRPGYRWTIMPPPASLPLLLHMKNTLNDYVGSFIVKCTASLKVGWTQDSVH